MDQLSESLRLAADPLPPSTIDIDALVRGERARRWQVRSRVAVATAFVATAAVIAVPALNPGTVAGPSDCSPFLPSATWPDLVPFADPPVGWYPGSLRSPLRPLAEAENTAVERLSAALRASLVAALPGFQLSDAIHPRCPEIRFEPDIPPAKYLAYALARDAAGYAAIAVLLTPAMDIPSDQYLGQYEQRDTRPDGSQIGWRSSAGYIQVRVVRPDGTILTLESRSVHAKDGSRDRALAATRDDLIAIGLNPALTLYP